MEKTTLENSAVEILIGLDGIVRFLEENVGKAFALPRFRVERDVDL